MKSINKDELHDLFKKIANKNELAFNVLYEKYNKLVYAIAFSILKNKENSEDVVQVVFTKIWNMNKEKLPTRNETTWLYSLTKNETLNFLRNQKDMVNFDELYYITSEDEQLNDVINQDDYNKIIAKLNLQEQEIVSLKLLSNLSFKEISQILGIPIGTVQWKYYKSLHTLKILLSNLSMFIIAITIFIVSKTNKTDKNANIMSEEEIIKEPAQTQKEDEVVENSMYDSIENETIENTIEETEENTNLTTVDIGILCISSIFLVITIIFSIIFAKHQQKAKKKVSK